MLSATSYIVFSILMLRKIAMLAGKYNLDEEEGCGVLQLDGLVQTCVRNGPLFTCWQIDLYQ